MQSVPRLRIASSGGSLATSAPHLLNSSRTPRLPVNADASADVIVTPRADFDSPRRSNPLANVDLLISKQLSRRMYRDASPPPPPPRGRPFRSTFARKRRVDRMALYRNRWMYPVGTMHVAATRIQAAFRGFLARRRLGMLPWQIAKSMTADPSGASLSKFAQFAIQFQRHRGRLAPLSEEKDHGWPWIVLAKRARLARKSQRLALPPVPVADRMPSQFLILQYRRFQLKRSALTPYIASAAESAVLQYHSKQARTPAPVARMPPMPASLARVLSHHQSKSVALPTTSTTITSDSMNMMRAWADEQQQSGGAAAVNTREFRDWAATRIQSAWRGYLARREFTARRHLVRQIAAYQIQQCWRRFKLWRASHQTARRTVWSRGRALEDFGAATPDDSFSTTHRAPSESPQSPAVFGTRTSLAFYRRRVRAVNIIARAWRRFMDMRIFAYYRDLVRQRERGDPAMLLKVLSPHEAFLADPAAGLHVRFRLGGLSFPPTVYYKIFTHRPITDIGSFAPRDYTKSRDEHIKNPMTMNDLARTQQQNPSGTAGWYRRWENNGWRPLSFTAPRFEDLQRDAIAAATAAKRTEWHHSKLVRRQDAVQKKRAAKLAWLRKMYKLGLVQGEHDGAMTARGTSDTAPAHLVDSKDGTQPSAEQLTRRPQSAVARGSSSGSVFREKILAGTVGRQPDSMIPPPSRGTGADSAFDLFNKAPLVQTSDDFNLSNDALELTRRTTLLDRVMTRVDAHEAASKAVQDPNWDWEKEADELLHWSSALDFDAYSSNWRTLATSGIPQSRDADEELFAGLGIGAQTVAPATRVPDDQHESADSRSWSVPLPAVRPETGARLGFDPSGSAIGYSARNIYTPVDDYGSRLEYR